MNEGEYNVVSISSLFGPVTLARYTSKKKENGRGERLKLISQKTGYAIPFVGKKLKGMHDLATLDYIISVCKDAALTKKRSWKHQFDIEVLRVWETEKPPTTSGFPL